MLKKCCDKDFEFLKRTDMKRLIPLIAVLLCSCSDKNVKRQIEHDSIEDTIIVQGLLPSNECIPNSNCVRAVDAYDRPTGSIRDMLYEQLDSAEVYDDNILYGYWFKPHEACAVNIIFKKDNSFVMRDYDPNDEKSVVYERVGTFKVKDDSIHLSSKDGWHLSLRHWKVWNNDPGKYLTLNRGKKDFRYYLVKGSD